MQAFPKLDAILLCCAAASIIALLSACPGGGEQPPSAACVKAYEKCTLASGVLGVCDNVDCAAGQTPPCLVCRSQH
jgi:hypothetical protein